jgi:hypothetical protein
MREGLFLFVRHRNALLEPVLRTFEIHVFDPSTGEITLLQQYQEKSYLLPVVSPDRTTVTYHSLIEGNDFLVTRNIITGKATRLRFDTSGYFLNNTLHYDNETVASTLKRGINRQAIYIISNDFGTIHRLQNGTDFRELGFLYNRSVYYVDRTEDGPVLGVVRSDGKGSTIIDVNVEYVEKAPNGKAILYSVGSNLYMYRAYNNEKLQLTEHFSSDKGQALIAPDSSACVVYDRENTLVVNIPSGDVLYYLSFRGDGSGDLISRYTYYTVKGNQVYTIKYKKPGQYLEKTFSDAGQIHLLATSPDDRYIIYQLDSKQELRFFDTQKREIFSKSFDFTIERIIVSPFMKLTEAIHSIYIIATSASGEDPSSPPVRELYMYNFPARSLRAISTAEETDIESYLRER